jgi:hypothetical protein
MELQMTRQLSPAEYDRYIKEKLCFCGSMKPKHPLIDARGIFCTYVCDNCEKDKRKGYRVDVLNNRNYWHDEPIDD